MSLFMFVKSTKAKIKRLGKNSNNCQYVSLSILYACSFNKTYTWPSLYL